MNKPVIYLQRYEIDELSISRDFNESDLEEKEFSLSAKVGVTEDNANGAVQLSVSLVDKENKKKLSTTITGYFDVNIEKNIFDILYTNGTSILYPYLRSIVSIVSAIDSSEAMLLPTINVLELLNDSSSTD